MPTEPTCPDVQQLQDFLSGRLPTEHSRRIQAHLQGCDPCRAAFQGMFALDDTRPTLSPEVGRFAATDSTPNGISATSATPVPSCFRFLLPPAEPGEIGRLGNYRVLRFLNKGGMGYVFHAEDLDLGRPVALKVMSPELKVQWDGADRFRREAKAMAKIKHENLVTIYQVDQEGDAVFFAMELLEGESLKSWMQRVPRPPINEILRVGREIANGLAVLHSHHLIHRDIKPDNLWLEAPSGRVKILDLGLVRPANQEDALTMAGTIMGTPGYMSPEQARGDAVNARSDLFSLGSVLYALCTGQKPFRKDNLLAELTALAVYKPKNPMELNPQVPQALADLVMQLLAKSPKKRPESAEAVRKQLDEIRRGSKQTPAPTQRPAVRQDPRLTRKKERSVRIKVRARQFNPIWVAAGVLGASAVIAGLSVAAALVIRSGQPTDVAPKSIVAAAKEKEKVFLTDLDIAALENWPFELPEHDPAEGRHPRLSIKGNSLRHGIFMHPPVPPFEGEPASLSYKLGKKYDTFNSGVSMNDGPKGSYSPCTFRVYGDGKMLWESKKVWSQDDAQKFTVPIRGVDMLRIEVVCPGPPMGAHAVWIDPMVMTDS